MKRLFLMVMLYLFIAGCIQSPAASPTAAPQRPDQLAFKGMELYSWQDAAGAWRFSLLPGTNRIKKLSEVTAASMSLEETAAALGRLASGESVFWSTRVEADRLAEVNLALPPGAIRDSLKKAADQAGVRLTIKEN